MKRILLSEKIKKAPPFLTIEPYLRPQDKPVASHPEAREPRLVPLVVIDYGSLAARIRQMRYIGRLLFGAVGEMWKSARSIRWNPYGGKKTIDPQILAELESYAKSLGIAEIGYTVVNPRYIFRGFRILFPNAMVFTIEMNREKIRQAPSIPSFIEVFRTYYEVGVIVNKVANFLRERGFNAHAGPAIGGDVNYIPVAIDAGMGISGKNGLLITHHNGPRAPGGNLYRDRKPAFCAGEPAWLGARLLRSLQHLCPEMPGRCDLPGHKNPSRWRTFFHRPHQRCLAVFQRQWLHFVHKMLSL